jgi:hypothetical protein
MAAPIAFDPSSYSFDSVALNAIIAYGIRYMRNSSNFKFISRYTPGMTKAVSAILAAATASLMTVTWDIDQGGSGTLTIAGITVANVASFLWLLVKNYTFQGIGMAGMDVWQKTMLEPNAPVVVTGKPDKPAPVNPVPGTYIDEI